MLDFKTCEEVKQNNSMKRSSTKKRSVSPWYGIRSLVRYRALLPKILELKDNPPIGPGAFRTYTIEGVLGDGYADAASWKQPPHVRFANLPLAHPENLPLAEFASPPLDPNAVKTFIKEYGVVRAVVINGPFVPAELGRPRAEPYFQEHSAELANVHAVLRRAWAGNPSEADEFEGMTGTERLSAASTIELWAASDVKFHYSDQGIELVAKNLWTFICLLFLHDYGAGRTGICARPDCPTPYFLKKRRTQRYCERGDCTNWAHEQSALRWWNRVGKEVRAKKQAKAQSRRRKP